MARAHADKNVIEIREMIRREAAHHAKVKKDLYNFTRRVHRYWKRIAPVGDPSGLRYEDNFGGPLPSHWKQRDDEAGSYKAGIVMRKSKYIAGFPSYKVSATDYKSHWIEYGTGGDTPTPEFACRQKVVTRFAAVKGVEVGMSGVDQPFSSTVKRAKKRGEKLEKVPRRRGATRLSVSGTPEGKPARKGKGYEPIDIARDNKWKGSSGVA